MRYLLIALLMGALVVEVWAIYWMNEGAVEEEAAQQQAPAQFPQTGDVPIGEQLAARERRLAAYEGEPVWPLNPNQGDRVVRGFVYRDGVPVRGASVAIDERPFDGGVRLEGYIGHPRWTDTTEDNGYFEVATLPEGNFILRAWDDKGLAVTRVDLPAHVEAHEAVLTLEPAQPMFGVVVAENAETGEEQPVNDALVFPLVNPQQGATGESALLGYIPTRTDRDGAFAFPHLRGSVRFAVHAPQRAPWVSPLVPVGSDDLRFKLAQGGMVDGLLKRQGDEGPLTRTVHVTLESKGLPLAPFTARVDRDAGFQFEGLPAGDYEVGLEEGDFVLAQPRVQLSVWPGKSVTVPPLTVQPAGAIGGQVVDAEGRPLEAIRLRATQGKQAHVAVTNRAGYYDLQHLSPGNYRVAVEDVRGMAVAPPQAQVAVAAGAKAEGPQFTLSPGPATTAINWVVTDTGGTPIKGAAVHYRLESQGGGAVHRVEGVALTDDAGMARTENVPLGWRFGAYASTPGMVSKPTGWETLQDAAESEVALTVDTLATARAEGTIVRGGALPVPGRMVTAIYAPDGMGWPLNRRVTANAEGRFDFTALAAGAYRICAAGDNDACIDLQLSPGESATGLQITLK